MTSQPTTDVETGTTGPVARDTPGAAHFGSSLYGGRPTFALVRREAADGATLTLYELLPAEQATARRQRLERALSNRSLVIEPFDEVFAESVDPDATRWSWDDWAAVKVARLSESRLRATRPLIRETLGSVDRDVAGTNAGDTDIFLPENAGIRLALAFLGIKPIQRVDRMRAFCRGIARMSDEECYYWHAKCRSPSSPSGEKALRTMLTDHV